MVSFIMIILALAIFIVVWIKFKEIGHKTKFTTLLVIIVLLFGSIGYVWMQARPNLANYEGFVSLGKSYFAWLGGLFNNLGSITSFATKQLEWGITNTTG